jgi:hypothetical protein
LAVLEITTSSFYNLVSFLGIFFVLALSEKFILSGNYRVVPVGFGLCPLNPFSGLLIRFLLTLKQQRYLAYSASSIVIFCMVCQSKYISPKLWIYKIDGR